MSYIHCKHCCPCCSNAEKPSEKAKGMGAQLIVICVILFFFVRVGQLQNSQPVDTQPANLIDRTTPRTVSN
jgi:hypothetical protein